MIDAETTSANGQSQRKPSPQRDSNHPLPMWPMAHIYPAQREILTTEAERGTAGDGQERDDAVSQVAAALRAAERAHHRYVNELRQGDVESAEDWSTWYAEYLLGLR